MFSLALFPMRMSLSRDCSKRNYESRKTDTYKSFEVRIWGGGMSVLTLKNKDECSLNQVRPQLVGMNFLGQIGISERGGEQFCFVKSGFY